MFAFKERTLMYNYYLCPKREIFCIDQKSFFASVSCLMNGWDPKTTYLAVVGDVEEKGSVVLAATPKMKEIGIKTGSRHFEIPKADHIKVINPSMKTYLTYSKKITEIALQYVAPEDFHQYSIDEFFMDVTDSYHLFADTPYELAEILKAHIYRETLIECAIGIGDNVLLSKVSLDIEAKKMPNGITEWRYHDIPEKLWPISPLRNFFGINKRSEKKLNQRGIFTVKDLALYPVEYLKKDFGVIGIDWHMHANGLDFSKLSEKYNAKSPTIAKSQILMRDYEFHELYVVILEHVDEVIHRLRLMNRFARTIQFQVTTKYGKSYRQQFTIDEGTHDENEVMFGIWIRLKKIADESALYRTISVSLTNLISNKYIQGNLFKENDEKREQLLKTIDELKIKYGTLSVMRALSMTEASTLKLREGLIAGHKR